MILGGEIGDHLAGSLGERPLAQPQSSRRRELRMGELSFSADGSAAACIRRWAMATFPDHPCGAASTLMNLLQAVGVPAAAGRGQLPGCWRPSLIPRAVPGRWRRVRAWLNTRLARRPCRLMLVD